MMINNIVSLFVGQNSKKRQMGIGAGGIAMTLLLLGVIDFEQFRVAMYFVGFWTGLAFSAKLTKIAKELKK